MKPEMICLTVLAAWLITSAVLADEVTLSGWGIDERNLDTCMADAEAVGFDALITWNTDPAALVKIVQAAAPHGIKVFSSIAPMGRPTVSNTTSGGSEGRVMVWRMFSPIP